VGYTTIDVGNIFKSLFRIYKTTELLMQHHIYQIHISFCNFLSDFKCNYAAKKSHLTTLLHKHLRTETQWNVTKPNKVWSLTCSVET